MSQLVHPFYFLGKNMYAQQTIPTVEVNDEIFDLIDCWDLRTLPVHRSKGVYPGSLICFECPSILNWNGEHVWLYAIALEVEPCSYPAYPGETRQYECVCFEIVKNLDSVVLF